MFYGLEQLLHTPAVSSFMLVKAPEEPEYLQWLAAGNPDSARACRTALRRPL
ncbi:hypothetical protein LNQ03_06325 [Klebsiella pneumoniae subsp. pneumoniae]|nr:hypothetical protein [Klebsiella pneumoniae subsp. pneumoniae]